MEWTDTQRLPFAKMHGSGNDFILIDNRSQALQGSDLPARMAAICRRRLSVGADGVILIEASPAADFRWRFFNSDGSFAEMCGNGARCAARFAYLQGICGADQRFETDAGLVHAHVSGLRVKVKMTDPDSLNLSVPIELAAGSWTVSSVNTGVPHAVAVVPEVEGLDILGMGREIRFHPQFAPAGVNADFICLRPHGGIAIRTYERGVEGETLACGTGAVAGALVAACRHGLQSPVEVHTRSGETLTVYFGRTDGRFHDVYHEGDARLVYSGVIHPEAWR